MNPPLETSFSATILTSSDCNFGCYYCFQNVADGGDGPPDRIARTQLTDESALKITAYIRRRMRSQQRSTAKILLFGGEPLMSFGPCLTVLEDLSDVLSHASIITNGYLLTESRATRLWKSGLKSVQVTFDGAREHHDTMRTTRAGGRPTFDRIIQNLRRVQEATSLQISIRLNVTSETVEGLPRFLEQAAELDASQITLDLAVIRDYRWNLSSSSGASVKRTVDTLLAMARESIAAGFTMARPRNGGCSFCGPPPGEGGAVIGPDGTLYSSWETAGRPEYAMGTVETGYLSGGGEKWQSCQGFSSDHSPDLDHAGLVQDSFDANLLDMIHAPRADGTAP
ncbi:radical SAM protein [Sanguibacter keddieii]|nr:radical SAM protein [Sanguibacter keddieii]